MLQPLDDDTWSDYFYIYKSQPRCYADLSSSAVPLAPDFRLDLGESVIINVLDGMESQNVQVVGEDTGYSFSSLYRTTCVPDFAIG